MAGLKDFAKQRDDSRFRELLPAVGEQLELYTLRIENILYELENSEFRELYLAECLSLSVKVPEPHSL